MNTLTDLRRTLDRHADDVADAGTDAVTVTRTTAVHHRIAVVRRRRRTVGAGVVSLALLAGVAAVVLPRGTSDALPTGPVVLGERAPGSISSLGYAFDATGRSQVIRGSGKLRLGESDTPRLLSWTLHGATTARFTLPGPEVHRTTVTHFGDFLYVPAGEAGPILVSAPGGSVGIATYDLSDRVTPAGYTRDGVTYRSTVAGTSLLTARIADDTTDVTTSYVAPDGPIQVRVMCTPLPRGYVVNVSLNGHGRVSSGGAPCDSDGTFDPGASGYVQLRQGKPGRRVVVRAWISRSFRDANAVPASELRDPRIGVGVYGPVEQVRVGGYQVPRTLEAEGRTWTLGDLDEGRPGDTLGFAVTAADRMAAVAWHSSGRSTIDVRVGRDVTSSGESESGGRAAMPGIWVPGGSTVRVTMPRGEGTFGAVLYDRVD